MIPSKLSPKDPDNYECLGYVAREADINGNIEQEFDYSKYACLHKRYLKDAVLSKKLWHSMGDPYPSDYINKMMEPFHLNLFSPGRSKDDTSTIIFDNFYKPGDTPKFLDAGEDNIAETWMAPPAFDAPDPKINIYQVNDVTLVKKFEGQYDAFSVWKPRKMDGLYPIGDIFVASES